MNNEEKKTIKLPEDLALATDYGRTCLDCWHTNPGEGKGDQIWCNKWHKYYSPTEAYNCSNFHQR